MSNNLKNKSSLLKSIFNRNEAQYDFADDAPKVKPLRKRTKTKEEKKRDNIRNYTQDFVPVRSIKNGIVEMKDGRFVKILEIEPINFNLRSGEEKDAIISSFSEIYRYSSLVNFQYKCMIKKTDSRRYINTLLKRQAQEQDPEIKILLDNYIKMIDDLGSQEALTRRYFIIIDYSPDNQFMGKRLSRQQITQTLNGMTAQVETSLRRCGNSLVNYRDSIKREDVALYEIIYEFFNPKSSINEPFSKRYEQIIVDEMKVRKLVPGLDEEPELPACDLVAPRGMDFSYNNYCIVDGLYYKFLYVKPIKGYPNFVTAGWANKLTGLIEGCQVDFHFKKEDKNDSNAQLSRRSMLNNSRLRQAHESSSDYDELKEAAFSAKYLKDALGHSDLFYMSTLITITAPTKEMVDARFKAIKEGFEAQQIQTHEPKFQMERVYKSIMPFNFIDKRVRERTKRNVMTEDAAGLSFMFTAFEISDEKGVVLGTNKNNNSLCILDPFNSRVYKNANMVILGTSGSGKTFSSQLMLGRMRLIDIQSFIIAPLKGHEFKRYCDSLSGAYIKIASESTNNINVMEIRPTEDDETARIIDGITEDQEDSMLSKKVQQLIVFFQLLMPKMSTEEQVLIDSALMTTYEEKGITNDNDSLYINREEKIMKEMPILGDLYNVIKNHEKYKDDNRSMKILQVLQQFIDGSASSFNAQTNVDLNNKFIVMDISALSKDLLPIGMFIAIDYCWDKIKEDRTKKKVIFMDEVWKLIGTNEFAANYVLEIFKIIRGYGGSAVAATQDLSDFYMLENGKYGKGIINNSKIKFLLQLETEELDGVKDIFKLTTQEYHSVNTFERGEALLLANNYKVPISMYATELEKQLITSDPRQTEELRKDPNSLLQKFRKKVQQMKNGEPLKQKANRKEKRLDHGL